MPEDVRRRKLLMKMMIGKTLASLSLVAIAIVGSLGVVTTQSACAAKTCTTSEESACTNSYTTCVNEAAASADKGKCQQCVETYCSCYDSCGNSCDRDKLTGSCAGP
jgi:hypothetical protein